MDLESILQQNTTHKNLILLFELLTLQELLENFRQIGYEIN